MIFDRFKKKTLEKPAYIDRIDELEKVSVIHLRGDIDQETVPDIEQRIAANRRSGSIIDKNVLIDYAQVGKIDSAAVAFHLMRLKEYESKGYKIGFTNVSDTLCTYLKMFKLSDTFKIYLSEAEAVKELNQ